MLLEPPWHHLVPFVASVVASCVLFVPNPTATIRSMVLKCLPVTLLAAYLFYLERWVHREATFVFFALILSALGDGFLVFPKKLGLPGIVAFGLAQIAYTYAFGFASINWILGGVFAGTVVIAVVVLLTTLKIPEGYEMAVPVAILYAVVIMTMLWRALDRFRLKEELSLQRRLCTSVGGVVFVISDLSIVLLQGAKLIPQPYSKLVTMMTYYLAQVLITLGATERFWTGDSSDAANSGVTSNLSSISTYSTPSDHSIGVSIDDVSTGITTQTIEPTDSRNSITAENTTPTANHPDKHPSSTSIHDPGGDGESNI